MFPWLLYILLVANCLSPEADAWMNESQLLEHVKLAADVRNFYQASSVFSICDDDSKNLKTWTTMFRISRSFSDHNVLVQTLKLSNVPKNMKYYKYRALLPLYVVIIKNQLNLEEFSDFAKTLTMSMHLWLVFIYQSSQLLQFCQNPDRNLFNVLFNTRLLIKCENDPIIREWYSLTGDVVKVNAVARWTMSEGFVLVNRESMWQRRNKLDNIKIRIATVRESRFNVAGHDDSQDTLYGLFGSVLRELADVTNFTVELVAREDVYGSFIPKSGKWSGVIGRLDAKEADIGVGGFGRSASRMDVMDLTVPLLLSRMYLYLRQPNMSAIMWSTYTQVLDSRIWILNLIVVIASSLLIALMTAKLTNKRIIPLAADNCFYIWGIQCQQALAEFPSASSLKLAFMSVIVPSMVIYINYSAALTSYLAVFNPSLPFSSEQEFVNNKYNYNLTVLRSSLYHDIFQRSNDSLSKGIRQRLKRPEDLPLNMIDAVRQVCDEQVVLCSNDYVVDKMGAHVPCKLMSINTGRLDSGALALVKHSPYTKMLNYYIENFRSYGILKVLINRHLRKTTLGPSIYTPVSFWSAVPILAIFFIGIALAILVLVCEYVAWYVTKIRHRRRNR